MKENIQPNQSLGRKQRPAVDFLYTFTLWLITTVVFGLYIWLSTQNHFSQLEPMINGTALRPYVYRVLAPFLIKTLSLLPGISSYSSALIVMYLSLVGFSRTILALAKFFLSARHARTVALLSLVGLIPLLIVQRYIYDFPILFLFTLALYFLAKSDFAKYILTFVFATLSKETSLFLFLFFAIQFRNIERRKFQLLCFIQLVIYLAIRLSLIGLFRDNPGSLAEFHMYDHFTAYLRSPISAIFLFFTIVLIVGIGALHTQSQYDFLRNTLVAIGAPTLFLYFLFGMPFEVRVFLETYPGVFLLASLATIRWINNDRKTSSKNIARSDHEGP